MRLKKLGKRIERYKDISEMPIHNWYQCFDLNFECVRVGVPFGKTGNEDDLNAFDKLTIQFEEKYGKPEVMEERDRKIKKLAKHRQKFIEKGDKFILNTIRHLEKELEIKGSSSFDLDDEIISLKRILKIDIDPRTTTVTQYEAMKKQAKQLAKRTA